MELRDGLTALKDAWWLPALGLITGVVAALLFTLLTVPQYTSNTQVFVSTRDSGTTSSAFQGSQLSQQRVESYTELLGGPELARRVVERLQLPDTPNAVMREITATAVPDTVLIDVTVTDPSAQRAQAIATALTSEFTSLVTTLETPESGGPAPVQITITAAPSLPSSPRTPDPLRNTAFGLLAGLIAGSVIAVVRARLDPSVRDGEVAAELSGSPVIGSIPHDDKLETQHVTERDSRGRTAEGYRQLRTNLQRLNVDDPPKVIMITSAVAAEGKTTTVINLALSLVQAGRQVALVDADLRHPQVTGYLRIGGAAGLANVLNGSADLREVLQPYRDRRLTVLAAGATPPNPSELLGSDRMVEVIHDLRCKYDFVLIDSPPLLSVADASELASMVDGVVLTVRFGVSRKDDLAEARAALDLVGVRTLGVILNAVPGHAG